MAKDIHAQSVPLPKFPMSAFDMGYSLKLCSDIGRMNCHYVEEVIPGDIAHIKTDIFARLDPLTFPIMHKIKVRQNFFFVPTRLILGDALMEEFFSCKDLGAQIPYLVVPPLGTAPGDINFNPLSKNSLFDQMECQPPANNSVAREIPNPIPFYAYNKIWMDYYADEIYDATEIANFQSILDTYQATPLNGFQYVSANYANPFTTRRVSYSKDRFTSAQPDAQRVGEVYLMNPLILERVDGSAMGSPGTIEVQSTGHVQKTSTSTDLRASLTIDELWDEMAVQRFLNSLNEFGNERYVEILAGQFGVISADARLQRAQWLGGNEMVVNISEVLQTSETTSTSPQGNLSGRGIVSGRGRDISFRVPEHGYVIGILTFVPENGYASGSPRWLFKRSPLDFAMPRFNNLGEQAVYNGELYSEHTGTSGNDYGEFGYQPQYDEYRSHVSRCTGDFRESQFLAWHLDRKFTSVPALNSSFIHIDQAVNNRIFNDTDPNAHHLRVHCFHKSMYVRPISRHPIPGKL